MKLQFLGGARQVTGSQYYLEADGARVLVDCGMHQEREHLARNWDKSPLQLRDVDALLLTHAHVDHCGLAPKLVGEGFRGPIITTSASADLVELVLRDSAHIQAEDAAFKRKRHRKEGRRGRYPVKPLYTPRDVERTLPLLQAAPYDRPTRINDHLHAVFHDAGHILGSAMVELRVRKKGTGPICRNGPSGASHKLDLSPFPARIVFTGDLGQWDRPIVRDPTILAEADYIVMESTYGDRLHENHDSVESQLEKVVLETVGDGGKVVVPIFAIERAQELIYYLNRLLHAGRIPEIPVFLDSPMAADVNEIFRRHRECFDAEAEEIVAAGESLLKFPSLHVCRTVKESMAINALKGPAVIMSTSGMCTAGRIKHHLVHHIGNPACTVLFVGYQPRGTLGRQILDGPRQVRIHGVSRKVRARVRQIQGISGHADRAGLLKWLGHFQRPPRRVFITHGEPEASESLAEAVRNQFGWDVHVPEYRETVQLDSE
ncbi:MAG: MBL fold metallo-hydrolase [Planctomycetes bacterium]|nr:MBL fold metallo-hydrolase [Planctomycetota bacterium]MBU4399504.1 MBL fold metallo-hydrolase [Planctomycetota bacterium]MCG2684901.1 MBL fold metallo-hydrolase [Planctomycetales bacterium]